MTKQSLPSWTLSSQTEADGKQMHTIQSEMCVGEQESRTRRESIGGGCNFALDGQGQSLWPGDTGIKGEG